MLRKFHLVPRESRRALGDIILEINDYVLFGSYQGDCVCAVALGVSIFDTELRFCGRELVWLDWVFSILRGMRSGVSMDTGGGGIRG